MRDLLEIAILVRDAPDEAAAQIVMRSYAVEFVMSLAGAVDATKPEEVEIVQWLRRELIKIAKQIGEKSGQR